ncbi:hypothetical protein ACIRP7_29870 [Streptomyces sp. NPDC102270]|uniref:hypothetical protein n=1 Tax=Streptomyces sp. NPDC102270 TaxID=3366150 RepID=UPI003821AF13
MIPAPHDDRFDDDGRLRRRLDMTVKAPFRRERAAGRRPSGRPGGRRPDQALKQS